MPRMKKGADAIFSDVITPSRSDEDEASKLEVITPKLEDATNKLESITPKSEIIIPKPEVRRDEDRTPQLKVVTPKLEVITPKPEGISHDLEHPPYNLDLLTQAIKDGEKNSRISLWSPKVRIGLLYLSMTIPRFSMSDETRQMLEEAFGAKYPDLNKKLDEELNKRKIERAQLL
jgi:hypothetical protein